MERPVQPCLFIRKAKLNLTVILSLTGIIIHATTMPSPINSLLASFRFALSGLKQTWNSERNFRIHIVIACFVSVLGSVLSIDAYEWFIIIICFGMVLAAELFNTAIEHVCNKVSPEYDLFIKKAKDASAAAVFVLALTSVLIGLLIFSTKLLTYFN
jgi:diacylglycerol kinase